MNPERRAYCLRTTALRRPDFYRVTVDGVLLTPRQRVERAIAREMARLERGPDIEQMMADDEAAKSLFRSRPFKMLPTPARHEAPL